MTAMQVLFILVAALSLGSAFMVVVTRNLIHAALWLVLALFGIAVFYVLLSAGFLAVAQVVIYIGAIAILIIFAIMLTRRIAVERVPSMNASWPWGALLALAVLGGLFWMLQSWSLFGMQAPALPSTDSLAQLGAALVSPEGYVLPFELASVLLLAALVGAIIVAWDRKEERSL